MKTLGATEKGVSMKPGKYLKTSVIAIVIMSLVFGAASFQTAAAASAGPKLSAHSLSIRAGSTKELSVKNTGKKIIWSVSDKKIAAVKSAGKTKAKVIAKKSGTCVVTAKISNKCRLKCKVRVLPKKSGGSQPVLKKIEYSNLTDEYSRSLLTELLAENGIEDSRADALISRIDRFNSSVRAEWLTDGFETISPAKAKYDVYDMQDEFAANNGTFPGYNCRITAFALISPDITTAGELPQKQGEDFLFMDLETIAADNEVLCGDSTDRFCALFAPVNAAQSTKVKTQVKALQREWAARGISFSDSSAHLISVIFHDKFSDAENTLSVGHAGVLLTSKDGKLYFIEKVAFQEPYRLIKFSNRTELSDYLMKKYDTSWGQDTARPFVMENDALMEGCR